MTLAGFKRGLRDFMRGGHVGSCDGFWAVCRDRVRDVRKYADRCDKGWKACMKEKTDEDNKMYWAIRDLTDEIKRLRESIDYDRRLK